jgi:hypothetical protein
MRGERKATVALKEGVEGRCAREGEGVTLGDVAQTYTVHHHSEEGALKGREAAFTEA